MIFLYVSLMMFLWYAPLVFYPDMLSPVCRPPALTSDPVVTKVAIQPQHTTNQTNTGLISRASMHLLNVCSGR